MSLPAFPNAEVHRPVTPAEPNLLPDVLRKWARERPREPALTGEGETLSYKDLASLVAELECRLQGVGLTAGDRVCLLGENTVEWVAAFLAILARGTIAVPLNTRLGVRELSRQIELSDPRLALVSGSLLDRVEDAAAGQLIHTLERAPGDSIWAVPGKPAETRSPAPDDPAVISFTSGTTGPPKGATISHGALVRSAAAYVRGLGTGPDDTTLVLVPLFHNTGFVDQLTQMLLVGGTVGLLRRFSVGSALAALERNPASFLIAVPSIYRLFMLREGGEAAFRNCRVAAYGGSPMPSAWIEELRARWPRLRLYNVYGLTEFTSVSHVLPPERLPERGESVGSPVAGVEHRVVDEGRRLLPPGEIGEIQLAGPTRMSGYWHDERATARAFSGKWLRTGDLGAISADGLLTVLGRVADTIVRGGEKIVANQVESALNRLDAIGEAAVVGAPHPVFQERVVACLVLRDRHDFDEEAVRAHVAEWVPDYAVPERFLLLAELPRNAAGKVDRSELRALAAHATDTEEER